MFKLHGCDLFFFLQKGKPKLDQILRGKHYLTHTNMPNATSFDDDDNDDWSCMPMRLLPDKKCLLEL